jgi:hypothetical protein
MDPKPQVRRSPLLTGCLAIILLIAGIAVTLGRVYNLDTHHDTHSDIWWLSDCTSRIPPTATDITLRREPLDHFALYTVSASDLHAFLDQRFAGEGETLDSARDSSRVEAGEEVGPFGWVAEEGAVSFSYTTPNGASSHFYHNPSTGLTYQQSAYW